MPKRASTVVLKLPSAPSETARPPRFAVTAVPSGSRMNPETAIVEEPPKVTESPGEGDVSVTSGPSSDTRTRIEPRSLPPSTAVSS